MLDRDTMNEAQQAQFEQWAQKWYLGIKADEFQRGEIIDGQWCYRSDRLQHSWSGYAAGAAGARADTKTTFLAGAEFGYRQANSDRDLRRTLDEAENYFER